MLGLALGFAAPPAAAATALLAKGQNIRDMSPLFPAYTLGFATALFCIYVVPLRHCPTNPFLSQVVQRREAANKRYQVEASETDDGYGMEHLWLNVDLQPKTMWVNLGYWKNASSADKACGDLFRELLDFSGISKEKGFSIIEVGSACAESAIWLMANLPDTCANWVGLTLSTLQAHVAAERIEAAAAASSPKHEKADGSGAKYQSFHADASKPHSWSLEVTTSIKSMDRPWLVATDVLVHFEPSRKPTIAYAKQELGASFAATDTIRRDVLTAMERLKLRFSLGLLDTPLKNVLTRSEYVQMLVDCGYREENIEIKPITEYSLGPYSRFVDTQGQRWQDLGGGKWDYADFWLVGSVFKWWSATGLVDHCMIVARA